MIILLYFRRFVVNGKCANGGPTGVPFIQFSAFPSIRRLPQVHVDRNARRRRGRVASLSVGRHSSIVQRIDETRDNLPVNHDSLA
jgi:hypothetical protein